MSKEERENTLPPFTTFRFTVVISVAKPPEGINNPVCAAAFSECSGLEMNMEARTIPNGGSNHHVSHRISPVTYGTLTLRRGMTQTLDLWRWFVKATTPGHDPTGEAEITMMDAEGNAVLTYILEECLPTRLSGPSLTAKAGEVALEEMQLVYARLSLKAPGQPDIAFSSESGANALVGLAGGAGLNNAAPSNLNVSGGPGLRGRN
ncbi:MAG: hypothetical protein OHK0046_41870 [Anaerolineae bacterium]